MKMNCDLAQNWNFFHQKFDLFIKSNKMEAESDTYKATLLLASIGDEGLMIYNNFEFDSTQEKSSYTKIVTKFKNYFIPLKNVTVERNKFWEQNMGENESYEDYVLALRKLASSCDFSQLHDSFIKDRIVLGAKSALIKDRLFRKTDLTLEGCSRICKAAECASMHMQAVSHKPIKQELDVDLIKNRRKPQQHTNREGFHGSMRGNAGPRNDPQQKNGYGNNGKRQMSNQQQQNKNNQYSQPGTSRKQQNKISAKRFQSQNCNKFNHFTKQCRSKGINS